MPTVSPQQSISQSLSLSHSDILTLHSVPFVIVPAEVGYVNVFQKAIVQYKYSTAVLTNVNNLISFKLVPTVGSPILVSNELSALGILGIDQSTSVQFVPANPYSAIMTGHDNAPLVFTIAGSDPLGGNTSTQIVMTFTYSIFEL